MKTKRNKWLLVVNVAACLLLTGLAVYNPQGLEPNALYGYPAWAAPVVLLVGTLLFVRHKYELPLQTAVNLLLIVFSGIMLVYPVPFETANAIKWWYPLVALLFGNWFFTLDKIPD